VVESSALLKRRSPKGYRGFESLPHRFPMGSGGCSPKVKVKLKSVLRWRALGSRVRNMTKRCVHCGHQVSVEARNCPKCGRPVGSPAEAYDPGPTLYRDLLKSKLNYLADPHSRDFGYSGYSGPLALSNTVVS
jgi:zinc ribbon protein